MGWSTSTKISPRRGKKLSTPQKTHLSVTNQLQGYQGGAHLPERGRQHFDPQYGTANQWKPQLKVDMAKPIEGHTVEFPAGKKFLDVKHQQKPGRAERVHIKEGQSGHMEDLPYGIKTFSYSSSAQKSYHVEDMMTRKNRVGGLEEMRNGLPMRTPGDKEYGHPDYAKDYFKEGGLIPGANIAKRKIGLNQLQDKEMEEKLKLVSQKIPKGMKWSDKVKMDARKEDIDAVDELDAWVENTLKEANPNYKDPDLFFENLEKNKQVNTKDTKKPAKK